MKPSDYNSPSSTRRGAHSGKPSPPEFPPGTTESTKRKAQAADPSKTALAILKRQKTEREKRIWEFASGNGSKRTVSRSVGALQRLRVSEEALATAPAITPLLKKAEGGLKQVLAAMRFAPDEVITAFLRKYDSIPVGDRERLPMEAIALAAGIDIHHLMGSIMMALQAQYAVCLEALPDNLHDGSTADALREICDLDLTELQAIDPPRGFGRD